MRRVGKGFSRVETPLFEGMLVAGEPKEQCDAEEQVQNNVDDAQGADTAVSRDDVQDQSIPSPTPPTPPPQPPQDISSTSQVQSPPPQPQSPTSAQPHGANFLMSLIQEALDACAALTRRVEHLEHDKVAQDLEITKLKTRVKKLERANKERMIDELDRDTCVALMVDEGTEKKLKMIRVVAASTRRRKGVVIRDPEEESTAKTNAETKSKDKGKGIMVEEPKPMNKKQHVKMDEEYARKLHEELNKDIDWDVAIDLVKQKAKEDLYVQRLDCFKGMSYDDIRPIFEAKFNTNIEFLLKSKEQIEEEENRAIEKIVPDEDDDVYTEATPLARKVLVVDYQIIQLNNKPRYKIIRADGTHQLYVSFITLMKNFDREDLESLWSIVKERFSTSKPNNYSDDYLLTTLRAMFERPDGQDQVWKSQRSVHGQAKVKSWKLLDSCGIHIISFTTTQLILLVERRYPLLRIMNPLIAQQRALDDALVAPDNHAIIRKCNMRIDPTKPKKEVTYQGMFYKKNVDFVDLIWEDFMYQIDNKQSTTARCSNMPYPRQVYGKLIPNVLVSRDMLELEAYKTYLDYATGKVIPKEEINKTKAHISTLTFDDDIISKNPDDAKKSTGVVIKDTPAVSKKKTPVQTQKLKGIEMLSKAAFLKKAQMKKAIKIRKRETSFHHQSGGLSEGAGSKPEVLDAPKGKSKDTSKGTGSNPKIPNVSTDQESKYKSWGESGDDDDEESDDERTKYDDDKSIDLNKIDDEEEAQEDEYLHMPDNYVPTDDETNNVDDEEYKKINEEMYDDVNMELKYVKLNDEDKRDAKVTNVAHVTDEQTQEQIVVVIMQLLVLLHLVQRKAVNDEPTQHWLSNLAKAEKPPLTFNKLMGTPIEFFVFAMNRLQISDLTKVDLVGPVYNLLKEVVEEFVTIIEYTCCCVKEDLYNNLKVYEPEVKGMSSLTLSTQNIAFVSSSNNNTSSSNETVNAAYGVSTASTHANAENIDNLSDVIICSFFASQSNSPQLEHEDLKQIHSYDIEEMDLRWQMAMLTIRARRFLKNTRRKLTVNTNKNIRLDKSKEECYNYHKMGHFAKEYDRSDQTEEGPNYALVANSSSGSDSEDIQVGEITIMKLEKVKKEKDGIQLNVEKLENETKSLNKIIESQIVNNCKKGLGYNAVLPPLTGNFMPLKPDLSFIGLEEFVNEPVVENRNSDEKVSYSKEENVSQTKTKKTVKPSIAKIKFVKSKQQEKTTRKTVKKVKKPR
nr:hypothetical protein [Tanacetum cinerariifolium]